MNYTFASLNLISLISTSPIYSLNSNRQLLQLSIYNSQFSRIFTNIIFSQSSYYHTILSSTHISHILNHSLRFNSVNQYPNCVLKENYEHHPNEPIGGEIITNFRSYFTQNCGNITITGCKFDQCTSNDDGGAICITDDTFVIIHNTIFNSCSSQSTTGGACFIVKNKNQQNTNFNDGMLKQLDIQYCCFQGCYGNSNLYGCALFSAATNTILLYASTVNCPGKEGQQVAGAQFDLQTHNIDSSYVNATGSNSIYCGGIEYRYATKGSF